MWGIVPSSVFQRRHVIPESYGPRMPAWPRKYTDEQLASAVAASGNMREVLMALGLAPKGGNYETVWRRIAELGLDASHLEGPRRIGVLSCSNQEIVEAVAGSRSMAQVVARLGIKPGGNQTRLRKRIEELGVDTSHLLGVAWRRGSTAPVVPALPLQRVLVAGRPTATNKLKLRLLRNGLKERRCESCGRDQWCGAPIPLELDHINGRREDNRLSNLRLLCPNCHAQTPTYRGKNIGGRTDRLS
jgi:5-methylcytosine-specific restriction endonuclease McrA